MALGSIFGLVTEGIFCDESTVTVIEGIRADFELRLSLFGMVEDMTEIRGSIEDVTFLTGTVDAVVVEGGTEMGSGFVYVADIIPQAGQSVVNKVYQDAGNTVIQSATVSNLTVDLLIRASYPLVTMGASSFTLPQTAAGIYEGTISVTLVAGNNAVTVQTPDGDLGAVDTINVTLNPPPVILTLSFAGVYPTGPTAVLQTELKAGDTFEVMGTTDKNADGIDILDFGAFAASLEVVASGTAFMVTGTVADRGTSTQALAGRMRARDSVTAAFGPTLDTNQLGGSTDGIDLVFLNNLGPSSSFGTITYPATQQAIKNSESVTIGHTASDFDEMDYTSPTSELTITNPSTFETTKTATRIAGSYNVTTDNLRAVATRLANGAQLTINAVIQIANVTPTIDITLPATRLRSGGNHGTAAQDHVVTITANQQLLNAPSIIADSGGSRGTFQGGGFAGGPSVWTRDLRVDETVPDEKGTFIFASLVATGLAGLVQNAINSGASYTLGGFVPRTLNFAAFTANSTEVVVLVDETKLVSGSFSNGNAGVPQVFGTADTTDIGKEGWFAPTAASGAVNIHMLHTPTVSANSGGITLSSLQETV